MKKTFLNTVAWEFIAHILLFVSLFFKTMVKMITIKRFFFHVTLSRHEV